LLEGFGDAEIKLNRHPELDAKYFQELFEVWPVWKDAITESTIYDAYFSDEDVGIPYWQALAESAHGRPVFEECRTSGRIGAIKREMGGYHIYLWRNPWDQWWSYKVTPYFDIVNQIIIRARNAPEPVRLMIEELALPAYPKSDLSGAFAFYGAWPLDSERSYLVFYMLWCLGLKEGATHADLVLNIDRLSDSVDYRIEMQAQLRDGGINGVDFSDCHVPQGYYLKQDRDFFVPLEERVHEWLKAGGYSQANIEAIRSARCQYQPRSWGLQIDEIDASEMTEQAARGRELARRFLTCGADAEAKAQQAEAKAEQAEAKAEQAEAKAEQAEAKAEQAEAKAEQAEAASNQHLMQLQAVYNSTSWRITAPLRGVGATLRRINPWHIRPKIRLILQHAALYIGRRPRLKRFVLALLNRLPRLKSRLMRVALITGTATGPMSQKTPTELSHLSPRARQIYADLKAAIEKNKQENV